MRRALPSAPRSLIRHETSAVNGVRDKNVRPQGLVDMLTR
jgi:hypothetical protein